ncbi:MAG TPA: NAD(P)/FAD-dependent oxidoreductase [Candidatus Baltobacteraceae bacterium]|nr:NAD(P)/FAD-dependent oxidoreductase [Candidatus Baltobacteraceae bacterium]
MTATISHRNESGDRSHVVIVGGGFGGLYAAKGFSGSRVRVTLVDKHNYHMFRPLMYQLATGILAADEVAPPLRAVFRGQSNIDVLMGEVTGIDTRNQIVRVAPCDLRYDYLILATGIRSNYFGHEDWQQFAPALDSLDDADQIRCKILTAFEKAERMASCNAPAEQVSAMLTFVLVGGGTVGVELAGTIAELCRVALRNEFRHIDPSMAKIYLYEGAPRILPSFPEDLSIKAKRHLEALGVKVRAGVTVDRVDDTGIMAGGAHVLSGTVLWSAGVIASPAATWLGVEPGRGGRVKVNPDLSVPGLPNVFVVGDTADVVADTRNILGVKTGRGAMPGLAQPAIQEGQFVSKLIVARVEGKQPPSSFSYLDKGDLAVVGRAYAVADLRFWRSAGFAAWLLWAGVHIYFLIGYANRFFVLTRWAITFLTRRRHVRTCGKG